MDGDWRPTVKALNINSKLSQSFYQIQERSFAKTSVTIERHITIDKARHGCHESHGASAVTNIYRTCRALKPLPSTSDHECRVVNIFKDNTQRFQRSPHVSSVITI
jgi:hypothetical protein